MSYYEWMEDPDFQDWLNELMKNAGDEWDDDIWMGQLAINYVRYLENLIKRPVITVTQEALEAGSRASYNSYRANQLQMEFKILPGWDDIHENIQSWYRKDAHMCLMAAIPLCEVRFAKPEEENAGDNPSTMDRPGDDRN